MESYLTAEISPAAVLTNLQLLRGCLRPGVRLCAVVKSDCYGLGLAALLGVVSQEADCLAVATPLEAIELRDLGYERQILLLFSPVACGDVAGQQDMLKQLISSNITLTIVSADAAEAVSAAADRLGTCAEVHVMIDTGMCRSGVPAGAADALMRQVGDDVHLHLTGAYTHLAGADEQDLSSARGQLEQFDRTAGPHREAGGLVLHAANSAATIQMPEARYDMVRPGIAVYGYQPSDQMHKSLPLVPALRLWGRLMQVKDIPAGSRCGYGLTHTFSRGSRIGLVPVGYADGYFRSLSDKATMRVAGSDVPVVGRVSMDQTIIDLTDVPAAKVGDVVEIISNDPAAPHRVENLTKLAGTIPHELTTRVGPRARRVTVS